MIFIEVKYNNYYKGIYMLGFLKKIFGLPTNEEVAAAKAAPYKVEPPVVNTKTGDVVDVPAVAPVVEAPIVAAVNDQITDAVTQAEPAKKTRKPRAPKAEKPAKEKAAKPAAKKSRKSKTA